MKLSELFGREVTTKEGDRRGWVRGVLGKSGVPRFLLCFDKDEREFDIDLDPARILCGQIVYEDAAAAKRECVPLRLGAPAFSAGGKFLGFLAEIEYAKNSARCTIGRKKFRAENVAFGDVLIVELPRTLKQDVTDGGGTVLKRGTVLSDRALERAAEAGQYVQAQLKSI
ncbi:MAG TPA: hypothetical protein IAB42_03300 [Candidatus Coproplasma avistercoris]|nr:hypothetical protein [Candidatus Coproplasma avistercoris]